ncbi:MAG: hypothetical protein LQ351_006163 [Letrouitia transgressa]|nr:MAG: hypothetical protein LQ351_006163 [Letrouitia transgressa]
MHQVVTTLEGDHPSGDLNKLKPCEYFDLIGGTGTGGLLAIMLGRLRMSIEQCKEIFKEMTRVVFETDKMIGGIPYRSTLFKASRLEDAIRACVQDYEHERHGTIQGPPGSPTRPGSIAVSAVIKGNGKGTPVFLRSYPSRTQRTIESNCTIWQAGRATCATGLAFKPIEIGTSIFQDTGAGKFNPAAELLDEATINEWPGRKIGLFLSIGCGIRKHRGKAPQDWWEGLAGDFAEAKRRLVTKIDDCETIHEYLKGINSKKVKVGTPYLTTRGVAEENYVRLNVPPPAEANETGVGDVDMNDYTKLSLITGKTQAFQRTEDARDDIKRAADRLLDIHELRQERYERAERLHLYKDEAPAYTASPSNPNAIELPGEDPTTVYPRPLSKPGPQYPMYPHSYGQAASPQDKFTIIASDLAPPSAEITPRRSEESSHRPSSELYGSDRPVSGDPRVSLESHQPPPLPPKTPIPYYRDDYRPHIPPRPTNHVPLPYPDEDGPPPAVNFARKPQYIQR